MAIPKYTTAVAVNDDSDIGYEGDEVHVWWVYWTDEDGCDIDPNPVKCYSRDGAIRTAEERARAFRMLRHRSCEIVVG